MPGCIVFPFIKYNDEAVIINNTDGGKINFLEVMY